MVRNLHFRLHRVRFRVLQSILSSQPGSHCYSSPYPAHEAAKALITEVREAPKIEREVIGFQAVGHLSISALVFLSFIHHQHHFEIKLINTAGETDRATDWIIQFKCSGSPHLIR